MNLNIFKRAFSLTELLIVLVVVAVLFAALLPVMTKRKNGNSTANEPIWSFVDPGANDQKDAYYDKGMKSWTTAAYIGVNPSDISDVKPYSKVIIKAKENQDMIQFRFGDEAGNGNLAGLLAMSEGNLLNTTKLYGTTANNFNAILANNEDGGNAAAGPGVFSRLNSVGGAAVVGANAMMGHTAGQNAGGSNTAAGVNSSQYALAGSSVFLGANTGKTDPSYGSSISNTVAVGAQALGNVSSSGANNVVLGYYTGSTGFNSNAKDNVLAGTHYDLVSGHNNVVLGYQVYEGQGQGSSYMTIAGHGACDSFAAAKSDSDPYPSYKTCLGYKTAYNFGVGDTASLGWNTDGQEHIFLGGMPHGGMPGRAALEVHNVNISTSNWSLNAKPKISPTVVMNSNLVVRGNLYFPMASDGVLRPHATTMLLGEVGTEAGNDRCGRRCVFGSRKWRDSRACSWLHIILGALVGIVVGAVLTIATAGAGAPIGVIGTIAAMGLMSGAGGALLGAALFDGDDYKRNKDPFSASVIIDSTDASCGSATQNYPSGNMCPDLKLSDIRLKENLSENTDALSKILLVDPYNYTFKSDKNSAPHVGVMAQDLRKYFPNSVTEEKNGYLSIRKDEIFFATINSVKELDKNINNLSADVDLLEKDVKDLTNNQKSTQERINEINKRISKLEK
ncbi:tail fiber domain-containing protein [bacterium]|nr:tail fiber domain-containing protein [bacterium]